jgi:ATP-dependent Clp protease protease subunit
MAKKKKVGKVDVKKEMYMASDRFLQDWFQNGVLIPERFIYLEADPETENPMEEVSPSMLSKFIKSITILEVLNDKAPIFIIINTPGGSMYDGLGIYDRIRESPCPVIAFGYGAIMSAGSLIMQAADLRQVSPNSTIMFHDGMDSIGYVHSDSFVAWAENGKLLNKKLHEIFFKRMVKKNPKLTLEQVSAMFVTDKIFMAQQALDVGLIDGIIDNPIRVYDK